jgi:hypothetical protein
MDAAIYLFISLARAAGYTYAVNRAVHHGFLLFLLGRSVAAAGCRGGLSQPPLFPSHRVSTGTKPPAHSNHLSQPAPHRIAPSETDCLCHRPSNYNVSFLLSVSQLIDPSTAHPRHRLSRRQINQPTHEIHENNSRTSSRGRSTSSVLIESARRPTLAGLPANTSQSPVLCQPFQSTPEFQ